MDFLSLKQLAQHLPGTSKLYAISGLLCYSFSLVLPVTRIKEKEDALQGWEVLKFGFASGSLPLTIAYASNYVLVMILVLTLLEKIKINVVFATALAIAAVPGLFSHLTPGSQYTSASVVNFITPFAWVWFSAYLFCLLAVLKISPN